MRKHSISFDCVIFWRIVGQQQQHDGEKIIVKKPFLCASIKPPQLWFVTNIGNIWVKDFSCRYAKTVELISLSTISNLCGAYWRISISNGLIVHCRQHAGRIKLSHRHTAEWGRADAAPFCQPKKNTRSQSTSDNPTFYSNSHINHRKIENQIETVGISRQLNANSFTLLGSICFQKSKPNKYIEKSSLLLVFAWWLRQMYWRWRRSIWPPHILAERMRRKKVKDKWRKSIGLFWKLAKVFPLFYTLARVGRVSSGRSTDHLDFTTTLFGSLLLTHSTTSYRKWCALFRGSIVNELAVAAACQALSAHEAFFIFFATGANHPGQ